MSNEKKVKRTFLENVVDPVATCLVCGAIFPIGGTHECHPPELHLENLQQSQQERKEQLSKIQEALEPLKGIIQTENELADLERQVLELIVKALEKK